MAKPPKISDLNQSIDVRLLTETETEDGGTVKHYDISRFVTKYAHIKAISSQQGYSEGVSEKDTYYKVIYQYHPDRTIQITDRVLWNGKQLSPVGDCIINDFGNKKYFEQKLKYTSA